MLSALLILAGGGAAAFYYYMEQLSPPFAASQPALPRPPAPPAPPMPAEGAPQILDAPSDKPRLPQLSGSDSYVLAALTTLVGNQSVMEIFQRDQIIHRIVATVDDLPREQVPETIMPVASAAGMFGTVTRQGEIYISPDNAARYNVYVRLADAVDPKQLVALYLRLYPLFQQAYVDLGYPGRYFNDRLMEAMDDMLAAPDAAGPVKLEQPHVVYLFADPELEHASVGQKIMVRLGSTNEAIIKNKLLAIKRELKRHMHAPTVAKGT